MFIFPVSLLERSQWQLFQTHTMAMRENAGTSSSGFIFNGRTATLFSLSTYKASQPSIPFGKPEITDHRAAASLASRSTWLRRTTLEPAGRHPLAWLQ